MRTAFQRMMVASLVLTLSAGIAQAAEVKVLVAGALQNAVRPLAADFEKQTGNKVTLTATNPGLLAKELAGGQYDVVAAALPSMAEFDESGRFQAGTRTPVARTGIGIAIREGAPKPDLSTIAAFKKAVLAAKNIIYTDPSTPNASGGNTQHILANAELLDVVKKKGLQEGLAPGRERIAKGEYEMGFFNVSEAVAPGIVLAGPVPAPLQMYLYYDVAVLKSAAAKNEAASFAKFLTAKAAEPRWKAAGLDQLPPR
ncbi:MAG TPA: substrate-binding domain-containing protein [Micropepsaceae bacterium]|nr:substrate-binding domain-containing protein [Micropepsaceae bacterium]